MRWYEKYQENLLNLFQEGYKIADRIKKAAMMFEALEHLRKINLDPGDILILRYPRRLLSSEMHRIRESMERVFPGHVMVVIDEGAELSVLSSGLTVRGKRRRRRRDHRHSTAGPAQPSGEP